LNFGGLDGAWDFASPLPDMNDKLDALPGTIILVGDDLRNDLARATESLAAAMDANADPARLQQLLKKANGHLKDADGRIEVIIQTAKATQPDYEGEAGA